MNETSNVKRLGRRILGWAAIALVGCLLTTIVLISGSSSAGRIAASTMDRCSMGDRGTLGVQMASIPYRVEPVDLDSGVHASRTAQRPRCSSK